MGPERGFRAGSKGRQGGLSQRRGLDPQLPFGQGANGDTQAGSGQWSRPAPVGVSLRLAPAAPVVLRSEGQDKVSPAPPELLAHSPWDSGVQIAWGHSRAFTRPWTAPRPSPLPSPEDTPLKHKHPLAHLSQDRSKVQAWLARSGSVASHTPVPTPPGAPSFAVPTFQKH